MTSPTHRQSTLSILFTAAVALGTACHATTATHQDSDMHGYELGHTTLASSPLTTDELAELQASLLFTAEDVAALRMSREILRPQVEDVLDVWYGFVGSNPHLLTYFSDPRTGEPDSAYLAAVRKRFGQWILDTAAAEYDANWLAWQHEIGLRHHRTKKNLTDGGKGAAIVHFRHLIALTVPVTTTLRPFLEKGGHSPEDVDRMERAWVKSVLLQTILWSRPYVIDGDY